MKCRVRSCSRKGVNGGSTRIASIIMPCPLLMDNKKCGHGLLKETRARLTLLLKVMPTGRCSLVLLTCSQRDPCSRPTPCKDRQKDNPVYSWRQSCTWFLPLSL